jgi:hypothetical protein
MTEYPGILGHLLERARESTIHSSIFPSKNSMYEMKRLEIYDEYIHINTYNHYELEPNSYKYSFHRNLDLFNIKQIIIQKNDHALPFQLEAIEIEIGGQEVFRIPYFLIQAFHEIVNEDSFTTIINIDFSKYIDNILLLNLMYHEFSIKFIVTNPETANIKKISFISNNIFLTTEARRRMAMTSRFSFPIHQFESAIITSDIPSTITKFQLPFTGHSQGIFINLSINKIKNLSISVNNKHNIVYHNQYTLSMIATKVSENTFFLPYIASREPLNIYDFKSYKNAISYSHFDNAEITIETTEPIGSIQISSMNANALLYMSGMGGLMFYKSKEEINKPVKEADPPAESKIEEIKKDEVSETTKTTTLTKKIMNLFS